MKAADRDLKRDINKATRDTMNPVWRSMITANLGGTNVMTSNILGSGVRIKAGNPPQAMAAQSKRALGRGKRITPQDDYGPWEFGVPNRNEYTRYERKNRKSGGYHVVKRRTMKHLPRRYPEGRVVYPAFAEIAPRMVSLWVQIIMKKYFDAAEGK
ncbi:hypothetical protein [Georgenia yuyongxinii]